MGNYPWQLFHIGFIRINFDFSSIPSWKICIIYLNFLFEFHRKPPERDLERRGFFFLPSSSSPQPTTNKFSFASDIMRLLWILLILNIRESLMLTFENKTKAARERSKTEKRALERNCLKRGSWERNWFRTKWKLNYITRYRAPSCKHSFPLFLLFASSWLLQIICCSLDRRRTFTVKQSIENTRIQLTMHAVRRRQDMLAERMSLEYCRLTLGRKCRWHMLEWVNWFFSFAFHVTNAFPLQVWFTSF